MTDTRTRESIQQADREKRRVAAASLAAAVLLTGTKLGIGLWTNSLGILSEAAHSGLDLVAAAVTLWAVRVSSRPADREHPYGHGKFENLSALFETVLLMVTCFWIIKEATGRLFFHKPFELNVNVWAFLVVVLSIVVDYRRSRALKRAADKYSSQALEADALHFSTDIWSSAVVLLGLCGVLAGERLNLPWLTERRRRGRPGRRADRDLASVSGSARSRSTISWTAFPPGLHEQVAAAVRQVPGSKTSPGCGCGGAGRKSSPTSRWPSASRASSGRTTSPTKSRPRCGRFCPTPTLWFTSSRWPRRRRT